MREIWTIEAAFHSMFNGGFFASWDDAHNYLLQHRSAKPAQEWSMQGPWVYETQHPMHGKQVFTIIRRGKIS